MTHCKVFILDSDPNDLSTLRNFLHSDFIEVIGTATCYSELETQFEKNGIPNLVITNLTLPAEMSWEIIRKVKAVKELSAISFIVISPIDPAIIKMSGILEQADDIIFKPFSYENYPIFVDKIRSKVKEMYPK